MNTDNTADISSTLLFMPVKKREMGDLLLSLDPIVLPKIMKKFLVHKTAPRIEYQVTKEDKSSYVRHKSKEKRVSKHRNKNAVVASASQIGPAKWKSCQDDCEKVKSAKSTSIKRLILKPKSLQNQRESVCARADQREPELFHRYQDAVRLKVDKATYVRYRDKKRVQKRESDFSTRTRKSVEKINTVTKRDKSTFVRYQCRTSPENPNHLNSAPKQADPDNDQLSQGKQGQTTTIETANKVDKSTYVRYHFHKKKNLLKQLTTEKATPKREILDSKVDKCTFVRCQGHNTKGPTVMSKTTDYPPKRLEQATQNSDDDVIITAKPLPFTGTGILSSPLGRFGPTQCTKLNKQSEDCTHNTRIYKEGPYDEAINNLKKQRRTQFDANTRTEESLALENEQRDSPYQPFHGIKIVNPGNIPLKRKCIPIENSFHYFGIRSDQEIFVKEETLGTLSNIKAYEDNQYSQSFVVDFGTKAIKKVIKKLNDISERFILNDDDDYEKCNICEECATSSVLDTEEAKKIDTILQANSKTLQKKTEKKCKQINEDRGEQTDLPTEEVNEYKKCEDKTSYSSKYFQKHADLGVKAENERNYEDGAVQSNMPQQNNNEHFIKCVEKHVCANKCNRMYADVELQVDVRKGNGKNRENNAVQAKLHEENQTEKCFKCVEKKLCTYRNNEVYVDVGVQADVDEHKDHQYKRYNAEDAVQANLSQQNEIQKNIKCIEKNLCTNKYIEKYEENREDHINRGSYVDESVQANISHPQDNQTEKCITCVEKDFCTNKHNQKLSTVGVQADVDQYRNREHNKNDAVPADLPKENFITKCTKCFKKDLCTNKDNKEIGVQADLKEFQGYKRFNQEFVEQGIQTNLPLEEYENRCKKCKEEKLCKENIYEDHADVGVQVDVAEQYENKKRYNRRGGMEVNLPWAENTIKCSKCMEDDLCLCRKKEDYVDVGVQVDMQFYREGEGRNGVRLEDSEEKKAHKITEAPNIIEHTTETLPFCACPTENLEENKKVDNHQEHTKQELNPKVNKNENQSGIENWLSRPREKVIYGKEKPQQSGVQTDTKSNIYQSNLSWKQMSDEPFFLNWFHREGDELRIEESTDKRADKSIDVQTTVETLPFCACPTEKAQDSETQEKGSNECKIVELKVCTKEKKDIFSPNNAMEHKFEFRIKECPTCAKESLHNRTKRICGTGDNHDYANEANNEHDTGDYQGIKDTNRDINKKRRWLFCRKKKYTEPLQDTCGSSVCKRHESFNQNIPPCARNLHDTSRDRYVDNKSSGIHIKYTPVQSKYMESNGQCNRKKKEKYRSTESKYIDHYSDLPPATRSVCDQSCQGKLPGDHVKLSEIMDALNKGYYANSTIPLPTCHYDDEEPNCWDYSSRALILLKKIERKRRQNMLRNASVSCEYPTLGREHWSNPCDSIRIDYPRWRYARSSSEFSEAPRNRFSGYSHSGHVSQRCSRSCRDCSKLQSRYETSSTSMENCPVEQSQPHHCSKYLRSTAADMERQYKDLQCPYKFPTSNETFNGSGIYLSREPYYQYQRNVKSLRDESNCECKNLLQQYPQYPYQKYEEMSRLSDLKYAGCDAVPEQGFKKRKPCGGLWKRRCSKTCKYLPQQPCLEVDDTTYGPADESKVKRGDACQQRCKSGCPNLPKRHYDVTYVPLSQREQIKGQGEGLWNGCSQSCENLENFPNHMTTDFDWVPANYIIQAKSSISESSSGFSLHISGKPSDNIYVESEEDNCICEDLYEKRGLLMKLKGCCTRSQTYTCECPPSEQEEEEYNHVGRAPRPLGIKLDVLGKGAQARGLRGVCCYDVRIERNK